MIYDSGWSFFLAEEEMTGNAAAVALRERDPLGNIFDPDIYLPDQFFGAVWQGSHSTDLDRPEIRLMLAVMEDGIATYQRYGGEVRLSKRNRRLFEDAEGWILSTDTARLFAYETLCAVLRLNAEHLRFGLQRWRAEKLEGKQGLKPVSRRRIAGRRTQVTETRNRRNH